MLLEYTQLLRKVRKIAGFQRGKKKKNHAGELENTRIRIADNEEEKNCSLFNEISFELRLETISLLMIFAVMLLLRSVAKERP